MDCSSPQTETIIFWSLTMFFGFTTFWFWALWFEGERNETFYFIKKTNTPLSTDDIAKTKDGHFAIVGHFHRNVFGVMRVKIFFFDPKKGGWMKKIYSPSRLTLVKAHRDLKIEYYLKHGREPSLSEAHDCTLQTMGLQASSPAN